ncbi:MAG: STAS domain-containing protein, partial [Actinoplanes sp.]
PRQSESDERDGTAFLRIEGGIDAATAAGLRDMLAWAVDHHDRVVVDLSLAESIERHGLSVLIQSQDRAHRRAHALCFAEPSSALLDALVALRADGMFPMFPRCDDAVTWLNRAC